MKSAAALLLSACLGLGCLGVGGAAWADGIDGTPGADHLTGTDGPDTITALAGDDVVHAGRGADIVLGGLGDDRVDGQRGPDELRGGPGDDVLNAGRDPKKDIVFGDRGADRIFVFGIDNGYGGPGGDRIWGTYAAAGMQVDCGPGHDVLIFNQPSPKVVRVGCEVVKVKSAG